MTVKTAFIFQRHGTAPMFANCSCFFQGARNFGVPITISNSIDNWLTYRHKKIPYIEIRQDRVGGKLSAKILSPPVHIHYIRSFGTELQQEKDDEMNWKLPNLTLGKI